MLQAAARLNLEYAGEAVASFEDLKRSWESDGEKTNTGSFFEICHGDYEGKKNQHWSRELEKAYMREQNIVYDSEPKLREKGGYEQCITHAKGIVVRQIMARSKKTHQGQIVLSLKNSKDLTGAVRNDTTAKPRRRQAGEFYYKRKVSRLRATRNQNRALEGPNRTFSVMLTKPPSGRNKEITLQGGHKDH